MEWLDKIKDFPNLIQQEPRYGYLVLSLIHILAPGCEGVVSLAKEEDCWSTVKLSGEIVEGADVEVRKLVLYYKELPQGYLPSDGIVPHFYWEGTIRVIPAELYV